MSSDATTPMMAQYLEIRRQHPDALLFYRMGDFYEMFFDDAVGAAAALDIALTQRGTHRGKPIPMCGVPVHSAESYLLTLIRKGFRVAIAEQTEDPAEARKRGAKSVVRREIVRLVTPGTLTEDSLLDARAHNFLAAFSRIRDEGALAWADISTGEFRVMPCSEARLGAELARLNVRELLLPDEALVPSVGTARTDEIVITRLAAASFDSTAATGRLCSLFDVASLDGYGSFSRPELSAMGALADYLATTQRGQLPLLRPPHRERPTDVMQIDAATRRNLEITRALAGGREGSLLATIDRTVSAPGARLLERRLSAPSCDVAEIGARLAAVRLLHDDLHLRAELRNGLRRIPDMDRALSRLAAGRGGPRDLAAIRNGLGQAPAIARALAPALAERSCPLLHEAMQALYGHEELAGWLDRALVAEPPLLLRDGGLIAAGFDSALDDARSLRDDGRSVIARMQAEYAETTATPGLRIRHNNVLGYFIEVTPTHEAKLRARDELFIHRQTTAGQVRFTTVALSELESRILDAAERALMIEREHFDALVTGVVAQAAAIGRAAAALAVIDVAASMAELAADEGWTAPVVDDSRAFVVQGGRHPVVEHALRERGSPPFVANDCALTEGETPAIWLLTGPNMAGKSTFLRQNALIALLAQTGCFVPAASARIGLVSQLFSRVGASDDLARGRSTFMVEMVETAAILNQADDRALVILDEIGRGTATWDGLAIAWATLEHLHEANRCRALFATHYHEMTALASRLDGVANATVTVQEYRGEMVFLHEVRPGAADRSYGVQVARLAGLPPAAVARAREVLEMLERSDRDSGRAEALIDDLPLFRHAPAAAAATAGSHHPALERLSGVEPDTLSPIEALKLVYELRALL